MMSPSGLAGSKTKQRRQTLTAEETKINFFNPEKHTNVEAKTGLDASDHLQEGVLETRIDPLEWKQEIDRVYNDLNNIEKEIEVARKEGGDSGNADYDEYRRHVDLILEMCDDVKQSCAHEVRKVFQDSAEQLEAQLNFVRKNEIRINSSNAEKILQLGQIAQSKKSLAI